MIEDINFLNKYLKNRFGKKVYKLSLNGGMTCPNRDGKIDTRGCIFCSAGGSGEFSAEGSLSIPNQLKSAKALIASKLPKQEEVGYIAYFQAYTNTYGSIEHLEKIFGDAIADEEVVALSIATRPDCLEQDKLELIERLNRIKPVFVELGLQTSDEAIASFIRRGYDNQVFEKAVRDLKAIDVEVVVHCIVGLPSETMSMEESLLNTIRYLNNLPIDGIKLQLLHILEGTDLAKLYKAGKVQVLSMDEYIYIILKAIQLLRKDIVIHRITGDGPKKILLAPKWSENKRLVLNTINSRINKENIMQQSR